MNGLRQRLRAEEGFGLVELMISLVVLNVGILAIVAGFNAGALALLRATETSTAVGARETSRWSSTARSRTRRSRSTRRRSTGRTPATSPTPERG